MPETIVKIIGSKYVRFPVEKSKESPDRDTYTQRNVSHIQKILGGIRDTESFRQNLLRRDGSSSGLLPVLEFQVVCTSHGASLTPSSLTPLLEDNAFSDQGNIRWKQILDSLDETEKEKKSTEEKVTAKQEEAICNEEEEEEEGPGHGGLSERQTTDRWSMAGRRGAPLQDPRPLSEPALHLCEPRSADEEEAWIDRFMKLENVLELCQIKDTGLVETDRAKKVITKYNLIYNLCLSPEKISEALDKFRSGAHILLGPMLHFLKEL